MIQTETQNHKAIHNLHVNILCKNFHIDLMNLHVDMRVLQVDILCLAYRGRIMQPYKIRLRCSYMYIVNFSYSKSCILNIYLNNRLNIITTLKISVQIKKKLCL